jgi:CBS domain-containing protein
MHAHDVMSTRVLAIAPDAGVQEIAQTLLDNGFSGAPVIDEKGHLVGIVSEDDLVRRPELETERRRSWWLSLLATHETKTHDYIKSHGRCATHVMSRNVITVDEDATLEEVADTLQKNRISRVPVMRDGKVVGIIARSDLIHGLLARQTGHIPSDNDDEIKRRFRKELAEADIRMEYINFTVSGGVVHVWGVVPSMQDLTAIRIAARSVPGVKDVSMHVQAVGPQLLQAMRE